MSTQPTSKPDARDDAIAAGDEALATGLQTVVADADQPSREAADAVAREFVEARAKPGEKPGKTRHAVAEKARRWLRHGPSVDGAQHRHGGQTRHR